MSYWVTHYPKSMQSWDSFFRPTKPPERVLNISRKIQRLGDFSKHYRNEDEGSMWLVRKNQRMIPGQTLSNYVLRNGKLKRGHPLDDLIVHDQED